MSDHTYEVLRESKIQMSKTVRFELTRGDTITISLSSVPNDCKLDGQSR